MLSSGCWGPALNQSRPDPGGPADGGPKFGEGPLGPGGGGPESEDGPSRPVGPSDRGPELGGSPLGPAGGPRSGGPFGDGGLPDVGELPGIRPEAPFVSGG